MPDKKGACLHTGHRQRVDVRFKSDPDMDTFEYHEMLEYILYYGVPRRDTNALAHNLIAHFGSFENVFYATADELARVPGMTKRGACTIASVLPVARWVKNKNKNRQQKRIVNSQEAVLHLRPYFDNKLVENIYMVCLDSADFVINTYPLSKGSAIMAPLDMCDMVSKANTCKAAKVILAHNHPAGLLAPSLDDISITSRAIAGLGALNISLIDHIIFVPDGAHYSFYQSGILKTLLQGSDNLLGGNSVAEVYSVLSAVDKAKLSQKRPHSQFLYGVWEQAKGGLSERQMQE
jgi:DNA repair protein RadC